MAGATALVNIKVNKSECLVSNDVLHETKRKVRKRKKEVDEGIWKWNELEISSLFKKIKGKIWWEEEDTIGLFKLYRTQRREGIKIKPGTKQEMRRVQATRCSKRAQRCLRMLQKESCIRGYKSTRTCKMWMKQWLKQTKRSQLHKSDSPVATYKMNTISEKKNNKGREGTGLAVWVANTRSKRRQERAWSAYVKKPPRVAEECVFTPERVSDWEDYDVKKGKDVLLHPDVEAIGTDLKEWSRHYREWDGQKRCKKRESDKHQDFIMKQHALRIAMIKRGPHRLFSMCNLARSALQLYMTLGQCYL